MSILRLKKQTFFTTQRSKQLHYVLPVVSVVLSQFTAGLSVTLHDVTLQVVNSVTGPLPVAVSGSTNAT